MLTSKQRAYLRGLANNIDTIFQVGKSDIKDTLIKQTDDALEARELIKIRVLETSGMTAREAAEELAAATGAEVVAVIGSRMILYRESVKHKKIVL
ncbi:MAG: ribosome assembly RNA-binding protein YhbY [Clostridia bacterium]|nr:ribosome assembly RNA-binding protein YhbY [Clostridia bacterium]